MSETPPETPDESRKRKEAETDESDTPVRKRTRSSTKPERDAARDELIKKAKAEDAELAARRAEELKNIPPAPTGNRNDKHFHAAFIRMGMGDCTIMSTPGGRVVVVDCGSDSYNEVLGSGPPGGLTADQRFVNIVRGKLRDPKFMLGSDVIDVLVLTHPDGDHYNKLKTVLPAGVKLEKVYHSLLRTRYAEGGACAWINERAVTSARVQQVEHHRNGIASPKPPLIRLEGKRVEAATATVKEDRLDGDGGIRILDEPDCKISILAGGVNTASLKDNSTEANRASIVVMVTVFGQKLLLSGDATLNTENYVVTQHEKRITGVDLATASHHGSDNTSSLQAYVDQVRPKRLVVSAGKQIDLHHLPSKAVIDRYMEVMKTSGGTNVPSHTIYFWAPTGTGTYYPDSHTTTLPIYITGSRGTWEYSILAPGGGE
ncbi:ComEC/Rec2 family competence protein [Streptosporangium sp. V21-05]|uniref:ComEC/Rec2 family competence protein n=1 Tax=Streptosporangium sp. V21-05 TaxID=3446115 RepID=UPI003F532262